MARLNITNYAISVKDASLKEMLQLRQVLIDNKQKLSKISKIGINPSCKILVYSACTDHWVNTDSPLNAQLISIMDFIVLFKKHNQLRKLAFYKKSQTDWTEKEFHALCDLCGARKDSTISGKAAQSKKYIYDDNTIQLWLYAWNTQQIEECLEIAYEDLFLEEGQVERKFKIGDTISQINGVAGLTWTIKSIEKDCYQHTNGGYTLFKDENNYELVEYPFKVGDIVRSIANDNPTDRPRENNYTVQAIDGDDLYYKPGFATHYSKFELVKRAEPEIKYPLFMQNKYGSIFKYTSENYGKCIHSANPNKLHLNFEKWLPPYGIQPDFMKPCDFTVEPEIFDIDWWDARFNAGLPIWYVFDGAPIQATRLPSSYISIDKFFMKPMRYIAFGNYYVPWVESTSCQDTVEANQLTQKEKTMTIQQLLTQLFGAEKPTTDYDRRSSYIVVAYNRDGSQIATAIAETVASVESTIARTPELWGCKILTYKLDKELYVDVPVTITDATIDTIAEPETNE